MLKIKINNSNIRYDVFQMLNLFYYSNEFEFVQDAAEIEIILEDNILTFNGIYGKEFIIFNEDISIKNAFKKAIYEYFSRATGKRFPWGTLVGIRPSKIALTLMEAGKSNEEIIAYYKENYLTEDTKTQLCIDVAEFEKQFVNDNSDVVGIYIGMPFCPTRCLYCSFTSNPITSCKSVVNPYLDSLCKEIEAIGKYVVENCLKVESVYFGGGTPTSIDNEQFQQVMEYIYKHIIQNNNIKEFTVECGRPDSITYEKLAVMKKCGVQRISINPQTMNNKTLKLIGRGHSAEEVNEKFNMARKLGFQDINMDIIVGLNGEALEEIEHTCEEILKLAPDSLTVHGMSIKRASRLYENLISGGSVETIEQEEKNAMYQATVKLAEALKMNPYYMYRQKNMFGNMENVGYSKKHKECIYNIQMIEEKQTIIAAGADAVSKVVFLDENRIERFANVKDVREYISRIDEMIEKKIQLLDSLYKRS